MPERPVHAAPPPEDDPLLIWAGECAAVLGSARAIWRELAGLLPRGVRRKSFVVPALAVSAAFLAGAWWLHTAAPRRPDRPTGV